MSGLLGIVAPVFSIILMGALALRLRLIEPAAVRGMTDFVFFTAMPGLLFASVAQAPPLHMADMAVSFLGGALVLFAVALLLAQAALGARLASAALFGLNCVYGNTVMLGIPVVDAAYGPEGVATLLTVVAFNTAVLLPLATLLIEAGAGRSPLGVLRAALSGLARNPGGVGILRDGQVLRDMIGLPLRDCFGLFFWAGSYAGDTIVWRGERFELKNGKLTRSQN